MDDELDTTATPPRSSRRRLLMRALIALVLAALLVGVPALLTMQPQFFERYPSLTEKYGPWAQSTHLEAGCEGCHVAPRVLTWTAYRARMVGEFYRSLVSRKTAPDVFATPTNEACLACHNDLRSVSPEGDLQIPHRAHVNILKMGCVECHNYLVHELSPAGTHTPPMTGCLTCHDGDTAQDACSACHTQKAAPKTHATDAWLVDHAAQAEDPECESCHKWSERWCADCHAQRPRSHGSDWREVHGDRVKQHRGCEACHEGNFCVRCHGVVPKENLNPGLKLVQ